jgi:EF hand
MNRLMIATAISALTAGAALAATEIEAVDMTGDGFATLEEVKMAFPEFDATFFMDIDTNGDNRVSAQEILETDAQDILARYEMVPLEMRTDKIVLDDDGDGFISIEDMRRGYPEFTELDFDSMDLNNDNRVSIQEIFETDAQDIIARYEGGTIKTLAEIDVNGDSFADFNELVVAYPGLSAESFEQIDLNGDNRVSSQELYEGEAQQIVSRYGS